MFDADADLMNAQVDEMSMEIDNLTAERDKLKGILAELYAMVRGECPSLLNEDSGGNAELQMEIEEALK